MRFPKVAVALACLLFVGEYLVRSETKTQVVSLSNEGLVCECGFLDADGLPHGVFTVYRSDGSIESTTEFFHGVWVGHSVADRVPVSEDVPHAADIPL